MSELLLTAKLDLSQVEQQLNAIAPKAQAIMNGVGSGTPASSAAVNQIKATTTAAQQSATAQADAARSAARVQAQEAALAAREVRRQWRETAAGVKDQLADTAAFSGSGIADFFFGIDEDRIRVGRLASEIGDLESQLIRLRQAEQSGAISTADYNRQQSALTQRSQAAQRELGAIQARWTGVSGAVRGAAATITSSLASSFLIGGGIAIATTAITGLAGLMSDLANAAQIANARAAQSFRDLGRTITQVGGADAFARIYNLSGPMAALVAEIDAANASAKRLEALPDLAAAIAAQTVTGASAMATLTKEQRDAAWGSFIEQLKVGGMLPDQDLTRLTALAEALGPKAAARWREGFRNEIQAGADPYKVLRSAFEVWLDDFVAGADDAATRIRDAFLTLTSDTTLAQVQLDIDASNARRQLDALRSDFSSALRDMASGVAVDPALLASLSSQTGIDLGDNAAASAAIRLTEQAIAATEARRRELDYTTQLAAIDGEIARLRGQQTSATAGSVEAIRNAISARQAEIGTIEDQLAALDERQRRAEASDPFAGRLSALDRETAALDAQLRILDRQARSREWARREAEIAANISRAGVATAGMSAQDVAANIAEARAQAREDRQDLATDRSRAALSDRQQEIALARQAIEADRAAFIERRAAWFDEQRRRLEGRRQTEQDAIDRLTVEQQIAEKVEARRRLIEDRGLADMRSRLDDYKQAAQDRADADLRAFEDRWFPGQQRLLDSQIAFASSAGITLGEARATSEWTAYEAAMRMLMSGASVGEVRAYLDGFRSSSPASNRNYALGGTGIVSSPRFFPGIGTVGEAGPEAITITPLGRPEVARPAATGAVEVRVFIGNEELDGRTVRVLRREMGRAAMGVA